MKKLFIRKPSGGGWLVKEDGKERACCNYEIEDCLREQILSLFDEEGVNEVMITVEIIKEMKIDRLGLTERETTERGMEKKSKGKRGWFGRKIGERK